MPNQFPPEADDKMSEKKSSQQLLLLLLLVLVGLFAYLYFFTGLIKPRGNQPKPQPAPEALMKKPLPPRLGQKGAVPVTPATKAPAGIEVPKTPLPSVHEAKPAQLAPTDKTAAVANPAAPAPAAKPAKPAVPETKPAKPSAPQATVAKPLATTAPVPQAKTAKPVAAVKEAKFAPTADKKPAAKPAAEMKGAIKPASGAKTATVRYKKPKVAVKPAAHVYVLAINGDLVESEMGSVMAKLTQAGIGHVVKTKTHKSEPMHRLFLADFASRDEALEEFERLKLAAPNAFMLNENGRYAVYAGSYLRQAKAAGEQNRLLGKGVKLLLQCATVPVAVLKVRAGSFADQASAEKTANSLQKAGLSAKVVKVGR